jgi:hypothetical protein
MRFGTEERYRQAEFRSDLSPEAQTCQDAIGLRNPHLLACGCEEENLYPTIRGEKGAAEFFRRRGIKWWKSTRSGDTKSDGPTRNLASSQVCCVNFLLPLAAEPEALLTIARVMSPEAVEVVPIIGPEGLSSLVEFEWVGFDQPLEGGRMTRGANQTSVDALMVVRTPSGPEALVMEWKYVEEYLKPAFKGAGKSGETRRSRYSALYEAPDSSFTGQVPLDEMLYEPHYQLCRLRLLADQMVRNGVTPSLPIARATVVVVCPEGNLDYRNAVSSLPIARRFAHLGTVEAMIQATLKDSGGLVLTSQEALLAAVRKASMRTPVQAWADYHMARYGW